MRRLTLVLTLIALTAPLLSACSRAARLDKAATRLIKAADDGDCPSNAKELLATVRGSGGFYGSVNARPVEVESWHPAYTYSLLVEMSNVSYSGYEGPRLTKIVEDDLGDPQVRNGNSRFWRTKCGTLEAIDLGDSYQALAFYRGDLLNIVEDPRLPRLDLDRVAASFRSPPPAGYDIARQTRNKDEPYFHNGAYAMPKSITKMWRRDPLMCVRTSIRSKRISPELISAALTPIGLDSVAPVVLRMAREPDDRLLLAVDGNLEIHTVFSDDVFIFDVCRRTYSSAERMRIPLTQNDRLHMRWMDNVANR